MTYALELLDAFAKVSVEHLNALVALGALALAAFAILAVWSTAQSRGEK